MKKLAFLVLAAALTASCRQRPQSVRIGYSPDLSHAPAVIGFAQRKLTHADQVGVRSLIYSASPQTIEALIAGDLDMAFVGPVPALNLIMRTNDRFVIVAGVAEGGASLVASKGSKATKIDDLREARVSTPAVGDSIDVAARCAFAERGFVTSGQGGGLIILPMPNKDLMVSFARGDLSAAWTVEPWATQLVMEGSAQRLLDDPAVWESIASSTEPFQTTVLVAKRSLVKRHPAIVDDFVKSTAEVIAWMNANPAQAQAEAEAALSRMVGRPFAPGVVAEAWRRVRFDTALSRSTLQRATDAAYRLGFMGKEPPEVEKAIDERLVKIKGGKA